MKRPVPLNKLSEDILDALEAGKISPREAKLKIPDNEKISIIEYISFLEEQGNSN